MSVIPMGGGTAGAPASARVLVSVLGRLRGSTLRIGFACLASAVAASAGRLALVAPTVRRRAAVRWASPDSCPGGQTPACARAAVARARGLLTGRSTTQVKAQAALARPGLPSLALRRPLVVRPG
jgi:hypothetical protein